MDCSACRCCILQDENYLRCSLLECNKTFHSQCTGGKNSAIEDWVCPECRCAVKKGGNNSLTPVGALKRRDPNVTMRQKNSCARTEKGTHLIEHQDMAIEVRNLRQDVIRMGKQLSDDVTNITNYHNMLTQAVSTISAYEVKMEKYTSQIEALHDKLLSYEKLRTTNCTFVPLKTVLTESKVPPFTQTQSTPYNPQVQETDSGKRKQKNKQPPTPVSSITSCSELQISHESTAEANHSQKCNEHVSSQDVRPECSKEDTQPWTEVRRKKIRQYTSICSTAGPSATTLKAVKPRKYLHVWNMASSAKEMPNDALMHCLPWKN